VLLIFSVKLILDIVFNSVLKEVESSECFVVVLVLQGEFLLVDLESGFVVNLSGAGRVSGRGRGGGGWRASLR
jgi:hypothetical protein